MNRLTVQKRKSALASRKGETRTKIQLGGLVLKSGLADHLGVTPGDDLQLDALKHEDAQLILGALVDALSRLKDDEDVKEKWHRLGRTHMIQTTPKMW